MPFRQLIKCDFDEVFTPENEPEIPAVGGVIATTGQASLPLSPIAWPDFRYSGVETCSSISTIMPATGRIEPFQAYVRHECTLERRICDDFNLHKCGGYPV